MSEWRRREESIRMTNWDSHDKNDGIINCHGGGAEVNNCRVNIFNLNITIGKDTNPETLKQILEILAVAQQQLPHAQTEHEQDDINRIRIEERRRLAKAGRLLPRR